MSKRFILAGAALVALAACQNRTAEPADTANDTMVADNAMTGDMTSNTMTADTSPVTLSEADKAFVEGAIKSDIGEIRIAQLALEKGQSAATKTFAQTLVTDHSAHRDKLAALAQRAGMTAPTEPSAEAETNYKQLQAASAQQFDGVFKGMLVESHEKGVAKYQKQSAGSGPLAELAKETVPVLQKHLELARAL